MFRWGLAITLILLAGSLRAEDWIFVSGEGHQYRYEQNANGAVLSSLYPVARFVGTGAAAQIETGTEILYLGRDCDAFSQTLGHGTWSWANGGFVVEFGHHRIGFPRQSVDAGQGMNCRM